MNIKVERKISYPNSIGGQLSVDGDYICHTLELPWRWNQKDHSCIPAGSYTCWWRNDRQRVQLQNIPCPGGERVAIQIHPGNHPVPYYKKGKLHDSDTDGCILVGMFSGPDFVGRSQEAMQKLIRALFGDEYGPGYSSKVMVLSIGGVLLDSRFDNLDTVPATSMVA